MLNRSVNDERREDFLADEIHSELSLRRYEAPSVISFTDDDIMEQLGPARASGSVTVTGTRVL